MQDGEDSRRRVADDIFRLYGMPPVITGRDGIRIAEYATFISGRYFRQVVIVVDMDIVIGIKTAATDGHLGAHRSPVKRNPVNGKH